MASAVVFAYSCILLSTNIKALTPILQALIMSAPFVASPVSLLLSLPLADRIGRRPTMAIGLIVLVVGSVISSVPGYYLVTIAGRVIGGLALGLLTVVTVVYTSELQGAGIEEDGVRWMTFYSVLGILLVYCVKAINYRNSQLAMLAPIVPACLSFIAGLFLLPESPRWLFAMERNEKAEKTLDMLGIVSKSTSDANMESLDSWSDLSKSKHKYPLIKTVLVYAVLELISFSYILLPRYIIDTDSTNQGIKGNLIMLFCFALPHVITSSLILWFANKRVKRWLWMGLCGYALILLITSILFAVDGFTKARLNHNLIIAFLSLTSLSSSIVFPVLPWLYAWRSMPPTIKGRGWAITRAAGHACNLVLLFLFPLMNNPLLVNKSIKPAFLTSIYGVSALVAMLLIVYLRHDDDDGASPVEQIQAIHRIPVDPNARDALDLHPVKTPMPPPTP